jgi:amino acid adenylation domain-containing protein/non-ribosomal peptide synthase protein (TIGR01720 family)
VVAILAVLKAGAAYLPIDPDYPPDRISYLLTDAHPTLLLAHTHTQNNLPSTGDAAIRRLVIDDPHTRGALAEYPDTNPTNTHRTTELLPEHPAYVIYTSGTTGTPKGVVVCHRSVVNLFHSHGAGTFAAAMATVGGRRLRVAHTTSFSFDASWDPLLWMFAGHELHLLDETTRTDPEALLAYLVRHRLDSVDGTPSYVQLLVSHGLLERNRWHPSVVIIGGEAPSGQLWDHLRSAVGVMGVSFYGPTECTVDALMAWITPSPRPVIGRPMANTRVYVLDRDLHPVPVGITGELYLSGAGLARGYLHRPGLTAQRFIADPYGPPGQRMYRTGDLARWSADGVLEYMGRVDEQVKIRGYRIEPGEIETVLGAHPGVGQVAVVAREDQPGDKRLVAYVVPPDSKEQGDYQEQWREFLRARVPEYMVPAAFVMLKSFPLTPHGKLDRSALPAPEFSSTGGRAPRTQQEQLLCQLFTQVLGVSNVGVDDDFFTLGGDSIVSIQLVSRARSAGIVITPRDVFNHKTVAGLAAVAHNLTPTTSETIDISTGPVPLTPIAHALRTQGGPIELFYQSVLLHAPKTLALGQLIDVVQSVIDHHDVLRSRFMRSATDTEIAVSEISQWRWEILPAGVVDARALVHRVDTAGLAGGELRQVIRHQTQAAGSRLSPWAGVMVQVVWFDAGFEQPGRLLILIHHLVVDGVSWRILLPDLAAAAQMVRAGHRPQLPAVGTSFRRWAQHQRDWACDPARRDELPIWTANLDSADLLLTDRALDPVTDVMGTSKSLTTMLPTEKTGPLLTRVPAAFHAGINDVLLTALVLAVAQWRHCHRRGQSTAVLVGVEGHGREDIVEGLDLSRTVGWFTSLFPVRLDPGVSWDQIHTDRPMLDTALKRVREQLRALPHNGIGYGALRYLNPETGPDLAGLAQPQIGFNYLGRFPASVADPTVEPAEWSVATDTEIFDGGADLRMPLAHGLELNAFTSDHPDGPQLHALWSWAHGLWSESDVQEIANTWFTMLELLVTRADQPGTGHHTPEGQQHYLDNSQQALDVLLPLRVIGARAPLFCIHPAMGLSWCYSGLVSFLDADQPIYGLQSHGIAEAGPLPETLEEIAIDYLDRIRVVQPKGPYNLLGWSFGGQVAHLIATNLQEKGAQVSLLAILDEYPGQASQPEHSIISPESFFENLGRLLGVPGQNSSDESSIVNALRRGQAQYPWNTVWAQLENSIEDIVARLVNITINNAHLAQGFRPGIFDGNLLLFSAALQAPDTPFTPQMWAPHITGKIENYPINCRHHDMLQPIPLTSIGKILAAKITHEVLELDPL